jgi:hypothetical protein
MLDHHRIKSAFCIYVQCTLLHPARKVCVLFSLLFCAQPLFPLCPHMHSTRAAPTGTKEENSYAQTFKTLARGTSTVPTTFAQSAWMVLVVWVAQIRGAFSHKEGSVT